MARTSSYASLLKKHEKERLKHEALQSAAASAKRLEELKSAHKTASAPIDWSALGATLPPSKPVSSVWLVASARRRRSVLEALGVPERLLPDDAVASSKDRELENAERLEHSREREDQAAASRLARAILRDDLAAFRQVLDEQDFSRLAPEGTVQASFEVHSPRVVECSLTVETSAVVPGEAQSVTATGRLTSKAIPRARLVELYQDYVCSLVLRIARELHALLPIEACIVTALSSDGMPSLAPILSTVIHRQQLERLSFLTLDPSDALDDLETRTNFKASRKSGAFQPIERFGLESVRLSNGALTFSATRAMAKLLLEELE